MPELTLDSMAADKKGIPFIVQPDKDIKFTCEELLTYSTDFSPRSFIYFSISLKIHLQKKLSR